MADLERTLRIKTVIEPLRTGESRSMIGLPGHVQDTGNTGSLAAELRSLTTEIRAMRLDSISSEQRMRAESNAAGSASYLVGSGGGGTDWGQMARRGLMAYGVASKASMLYNIYRPGGGVFSAIDQEIAFARRIGGYGYAAAERVAPGMLAAGGAIARPWLSAAGTLATPGMVGAGIHAATGYNPIAGGWDVAKSVAYSPLETLLGNNQMIAEQRDRLGAGMKTRWDQLDKAIESVYNPLMKLVTMAGHTLYGDGSDSYEPSRIPRWKRGDLRRGIERGMGRVRKEGGFMTEEFNIPGIGKTSMMDLWAELNGFDTGAYKGQPKFEGLRYAPTGYQQMMGEQPGLVQGSVAELRAKGIIAGYNVPTMDLMKMQGGYMGAAMGGRDFGIMGAADTGRRGALSSFVMASPIDRSNMLNVAKALEAGQKLTEDQAAIAVQTPHLRELYFDQRRKGILDMEGGAASPEAMRLVGGSTELEKAARERAMGLTTVDGHLKIDNKVEVKLDGSDLNEQFKKLMEKNNDEVLKKVLEEFEKMGAMGAPAPAGVAVF